MRKCSDVSQYVHINLSNLQPFSSSLISLCISISVHRFFFLYHYVHIYLSHFVHLSLILQLRLIFIYVTSPPLILYLSQTQFVENFNITRPNVDAHHRPELPLAATFSYLINIHLIARLIHIQCAISCHVHQPCLIISSTTTHQKLPHKTPPGLPLSFDSCVGQDDN